MPYLFNRSVRLRPGRLPDAIDWATRITEKVNVIDEGAVALWMPVLSAQAGTLSWSRVVEDLSQLMAAEEKLMADQGYLDLVEEGTQFASADGHDDSLVRLVHADPDGVETAQYASITTAVLAPGNAATGIALGVEMAERIKAVTGRPTSFGASVTGAFGEVGWIMLSDSIEQVQHVTESLAGDADWLKLMDAKASKAFVIGAASRRITRKVA